MKNKGYTSLINLSDTLIKGLENQGVKLKLEDKEFIIRQVFDVVNKCL